MRHVLSLTLLVLATDHGALAVAMDQTPKTMPAVTEKASDDWFENAIAEAANDRKYLMVVVFAPGTDEWTTFNTESLGDERVVNWVQDRANIERISIESTEGRAFSERFGLTRWPSWVIFSSDGRELGRQVGAVDAARVLGRLNASVQSDAVRGKAGAHGWSGEDVLLNLMDVAGEMTNDGSYAQALDYLTWCMDHRVARSPTFAIAHLGDLIEKMATLGRRYEPAETELSRRISKAELDSIRTERPNVFGYYIIKYGHLALDREERAIAFYDRLRKRWPGSNNSAAFATLIYGPLLKAKRYRALAPTVADTDNVDVFLDEARRSGRPAQEVHDLLSGRFEILLGLGKNDDARSLAQKIFAYDKSAAAYVGLAEGAFRSGRSTDTHINYARQGYLLSEGKDARAVIVLAKLMAQKTAKDPDAIDLVRNALKTKFEQADVSALTQCLYDIQSDKIPRRGKINARIRKDR
jgi:tetratricopeptide (TPR) repeat protein